MLRRRAKKAEDPIGDFWAWWAGARPKVEAAIAAREVGGLVDEFSTHVVAIHPDLEWELSKGQVAEHVLVVTSAGNPELRSLAERWRLAGPEPDATFEYASARAPDPGALDKRLVFDGVDM